MDLSIPIWGQLSIVGLLLGLVGTILVMILRGDLITGKQQDRLNKAHEVELAELNKTHAEELEAERVRSAAELDRAEERSRAWQEAWQAGQSLASQQTDTIARLTNIAEVLEKVLRSLPPLPGEAKDD